MAADAASLGQATILAYLGSVLASLGSRLHATGARARRSAPVLPRLPASLLVLPLDFRHRPETMFTYDMVQCAMLVTWAILYKVLKRSLKSKQYNLELLP